MSKWAILGTLPSADLRSPPILPPSFEGMASHTGLRILGGVLPGQDFVTYKLQGVNKKYASPSPPSIARD